MVDWTPSPPAFSRSTALSGGGDGAHAIETQSTAWTSAFAAGRRCWSAPREASARPARWRSRTRASTSPSWRASATCWKRTGAEIAAATGVKVTAVAGDITTKEGRAAALAACPAPDILLNNADGPLPGDFRDWSREDWIAALDMMMLGHIEMMRLTVDGMMARGFGRIVNIVSRSVKIPQARARPVERRALRPRRIRGRAGAANRRAQRHHQQSAARHLRQRRATRAHPGHAAGRPARRSTRFGRRAPPPIRPNATAGRPSLEPTAPSCARRTRASSPARTC